MPSICFWRHLNATIIALVTWFSLWFLRPKHDPTRRQDLYILTTILLWNYRQDFTLLITPLIEAPTAIWITLLGCSIALWLASDYLVQSIDLPKGKTPWLLPSRTSHTRLFPQRHSFNYSYLQIAIPVGSHGRFGTLVSVGNVRRRGWFHVQASDYLERNSEDYDLRSKLRTYLQSQSVEDDQWSCAYLVTAPRFLGYSFNPVSFWYIYTSQDVLTIMILEVNNTFDERRMYLLRARNPEEKSEGGHGDLPMPGEELDSLSDGNGLPEGLPSKFTNAWTKDFHVSPFNSRKGYYMLTAIDPFQKHGNEPPIFSNNITLKSSKDHVKLVARVYSHGMPFNPMASSWRDMAAFVLSWFWVGFLTFPRILKEATMLFWARKPHVWFRPEVMSTSIGRREEIIETELARFFEAYLLALIARYPHPIRILYTSDLNGSIPRTHSNIASNIAADDPDVADSLEIRVLSPVFFARFVHYAHTTEAFDREYIFTDEKNRTIWVSRPKLLCNVLMTRIDTAEETAQTSVLDRLRWTLHGILRCPPATPAYPLSTDSANMQDMKKSTLSPLDHYVMTVDAGSAWMYRRLCARLFFAQRFTLGFAQIVDFIDFAIRVMLVWHGVAALGEGTGEVKAIAWAASIHIWALMKGL